MAIGSQVVALPGEAVCGARLVPAQASRAGSTIDWEGAPIPLASLSRIVTGTEDDPVGSRFPAVVLRSRGTCAAFSVQRVLALEEIVTAPVAADVPCARIVAAVSLDQDSRVRLVLDPGALVATACGDGAG